MNKIGLLSDSINFPSLPLMKLSAFHKSLGDNVEIVTNFFEKYDKIYVSKIFNLDLPTIQRLDYLPEANEEYLQVNNHLNYMLGDVIAKVLKNDNQEEYFYTELKEKFTNKLDEIVNQNNRYRQALKKIEGIAENINLTIMGGEDSPKDEWVNLYTTTCAKILTIINEVKE